MLAEPLFLEYLDSPHFALRFRSHNTIITQTQPQVTTVPSEQLPIMSRHHSSVFENKNERQLAATIRYLENERVALLANIVNEDLLEVDRGGSTAKGRRKRPMHVLNLEALQEAREELTEEVRRLGALVTCAPGLQGEGEDGHDDGDEDEHDDEGDCKDEDVAIDDSPVEQSMEVGSGGKQEGDGMEMDVDVEVAEETKTADAASESSPQIQQTSASTPPKRKRMDFEDVFEAVNAHRHKRMLPEAQRRRSSFAFTIPI